MRADIETALRGVVTVLGESWNYRRLTSGPATEPRTYGSWTAITAHVSGRTNSESFDDRTQTQGRMERGRLRTSDAATALFQGDQVRDPDGVTVWAVMGVESSGVGTRAYAIERDIPLKVGPDRGGAV